MKRSEIKYSLSLNSCFLLYLECSQTCILFFSLALTAMLPHNEEGKKKKKEDYYKFYRASNLSLLLEM